MRARLNLISVNLSPNYRMVALAIIPTLELGGIVGRGVSEGYYNVQRCFELFGANIIWSKTRKKRKMFEEREHKQIFVASYSSVHVYDGNFKLCIHGDACVMHRGRLIINEYKNEKSNSI